MIIHIWAKYFQRTANKAIIASIARDKEESKAKVQGKGYIAWNSGQTVVVTPTKMATKYGDPFMYQVEENIRQHKPALEGLAKK